MHGPAALSRIASTPKKPLHWGLTDNKQAFTSVEVPPEHRAWVAGPVIQAQHIPRERWPTNRKCTPRTRLRPWYKRLAMGDAWSVFLLMWIEFAVIQNALRTEPKLSGFTLLNMVHLCENRIVVHASQGSLYLHVDDLVITHEDLGLVLSALLILSSALRAVGRP